MVDVDVDGLEIVEFERLLPDELGADGCRYAEHLMTLHQRGQLRLRWERVVVVCGAGAGLLLVVVDRLECRREGVARSASKADTCLNSCC